MIVEAITEAAIINELVNDTGIIFNSSISYKLPSVEKGCVSKF
jgi:hypothetical protein